MWQRLEHTSMQKRKRRVHHYSLGPVLKCAPSPTNPSITAYPSGLRRCWSMRTASA